MIAGDIIARLDRVRGTAPNWIARCPAHDDDTPSLSISEGREGVLLHCHAGCAVEVIVAALGLEVKDLFSENGGGKEIAATYDYVNADGVLLFQVVRLIPKDFRQRRPDGMGGWVWSLKGVTRVPYRLPSILKAIEEDKRVFVVEGEKDVHAVEQVGFTATCNPAGAGKWRSEYCDTLKGADVVVVADKDKTGYSHALKVAQALNGIAKKVVVVEPAEGKDVSDHLAAGRTLKDLVPVSLEHLQTTYDNNDQTDQRGPSDPPSVVNVVSVVGRSRNWPDQLEAAALTGFLGELVREIEPHSEADPAAIAFQILVGFGSIVGRGPHFRVEADRHHVNENLLLVGPTAKGRKGTSWAYARRILKCADDTWMIRSGLSSGEGLIFAVRDRVEKEGKDGKMAVVDAGVEDKRLLVMEGEFGGAIKVMERHGNTLSPTIRNAWDGLGVLEPLIKNSPNQATDAHIVIIGHITSDELMRLGRVELVNGFLNRFLVICSKRSKSLPEGGNLSESQFGLMGETMRTIVAMAKRRDELKRSDDARALWCEVYTDLSSGKAGMLGAVISRAEAHVMRLACLVALLNEHTMIERRDLEAALSLWRYCEASVEYLFGNSLGDPDAERLLIELRQARRLDRTEIRDLFHRNKSTEEIERLVSLLESRGLATKTIERTEGRPREVWEVIE